MKKQELNLNRLEKQFKVIYLNSGNTTYKSLVNYSMDLNSPIQRWYRYKEGYSERLVEKILTENKISPGALILDPFLGSGTTIVAAQKMGCKTIGYEVNPFSFFLAKVKTQQYSNEDKKDFKYISKLIKEKIETGKSVTNIPISILAKLYPNDILQYILKNIDLIKKTKVSSKAKDLAKIALLASLEEISNYRKAGNGLKIRRGKKIKSPTLNYAKKIHQDFIEKILEDIILFQNKEPESPRLYMKSSLDLKEVENNSVNGVIFSPPYANCFDYTEIYKVELWFGQFVESQSDIKKLKKETVRSHLSAVDSKQDLNTRSKELEIILSYIDPSELWSNKIPKMLIGYFEDMFLLIDNLKNKIKNKGFCVIVVSNSAYGGVVIPTDLILADYASKNGFEVKKIDVARNIITSSQQYKKTEPLKKYLRESLITLIKK